MIIKEIEFYNFRIYKGYNKISLTPENEKILLSLEVITALEKRLF